MHHPFGFYLRQSGSSAENLLKTWAPKAPFWLCLRQYQAHSLLQLGGRCQGSPAFSRAQLSTAAAESKALTQHCKVWTPWTCFYLHGVKIKSSFQKQKFTRVRSPLPSVSFCLWMQKAFWCPEASSSKSVSFCKVFWLQWNIICFSPQNALFKHSSFSDSLLIGIN